MNNPKVSLSVHIQCMASPVPKVRDNAAQTGASDARDARPIPGTPLASPPSYLQGGLASGPLYKRKADSTVTRSLPERRPRLCMRVA